MIIRKIAFMAGFSVFILFSNSVFAMTGQELMEKCTRLGSQVNGNDAKQVSVSQVMDAGSCAGFIGGVISGVNLVGNMMMQKKIIKNNFICLPPKIHSQQLLEIAIDKIKKEPELASVRAEVAIFNIFNSGFSCADKKEN